ncbi:MAG: thymidine phosphorylase, partial [Candidatus Bathyarchaeia archaeon]
GEANALAKDFIELGRRLDIQTSCAITYGEQPIGYAIGPALEAKEALETLMGSNKALDLLNKAANVAGALFQMAGVGDFNTALQLITSGRSEKKLREIIAAQGGDPDIKPEDIPIGDKTCEVKAENDGMVLWIDNGRLIEIARAAGAPKDKGAGILLNKKIGDHVEKGDTLFTIYAESSVKLQTAIELVEERSFIGVGKSMDMLIQFIHEAPVYGRRFELER